jgi:hypothetical protein
LVVEVSNYSSSEDSLSLSAGNSDVDSADVSDFESFFKPSILQNHLEKYPLPE